MTQEYWDRGEKYCWRPLGKYFITDIYAMFEEAETGMLPFTAKGVEREEGEYTLSCSVFGSAKTANRFKSMFRTVEEVKAEAAKIPCTGPNTCPIWDYCRERIGGNRHKDCHLEKELGK